MSKYKRTYRNRVIYPIMGLAGIIAGQSMDLSNLSNMQMGIRSAIAQTQEADFIFNQGRDFLKEALIKGNFLVKSGVHTTDELDEFLKSIGYLKALGFNSDDFSTEAKFITKFNQIFRTKIDVNKVDINIDKEEIWLVENNFFRFYFTQKGAIEYRESLFFPRKTIGYMKINNKGEIEHIDDLLSALRFYYHNSGGELSEISDSEKKELEPSCEITYVPVDCIAGKCIDTRDVYQFFNTVSTGMGLKSGRSEVYKQLLELGIITGTPYSPYSCNFNLWLRDMFKSSITLNYLYENLSDQQLYLKYMIGEGNIPKGYKIFTGEEYKGEAYQREVLERYLCNAYFALLPEGMQIYQCKDPKQYFPSKK